MAALTRRKSVEETLATTEESGFELKRNLTGFDVTVLGVGVIVGAGIFVLTGVAAAENAGPAITLSFALAAVVCLFVALCYAEFAALVPAAGSAYTYAYATLGEFIAFIIGWDLVLELTVGSAAVGVGFSGYLASVFDSLFGITLPPELSSPPGVEGGVVNLWSMLLVAGLAVVLVIGIKFTARATLALVLVTLTVLTLVIGFGVFEIDTANWTPYFPFGANGVSDGAAVVFFAFIGFDIVATAAEETHKPQRDMPIGILGSLGITTFLYMATAAVITGMVVYTELGNEAPVATAFESLDKPWLATIISVGALIAVAKTTMILLLGQTRVAFAMARDGLLPRWFAKTHPRFGTPYRMTVAFAVVVTVLAGLVDIETLADLVSIGTLFAFVVVAIGVVYLRRTRPELERPFRTPLVWVTAALGIIGSIYLMTRLDGATWLRFVVWMVIGFVVYFGYAMRRSNLARRERSEPG